MWRQGDEQSSPWCKDQTQRAHMDVKNVIVCPVNLARVAEVTAVPAASTTKLNASCVHRTGRGYTMVRLQETCTPEERNMKPSTHKKTSSRSC